MPKFGTKNALFRYFWNIILKKLLWYLKTAPSNLSECKILQKKKKKSLILGLKMSYLGFSRLDFKKAIGKFEISILEFIWIQNFAKKQKCLNLAPKMLYLGIFKLEF